MKIILLVSTYLLQTLAPHLPLCDAFRFVSIRFGWVWLGLV